MDAKLDKKTKPNASALKLRRVQLNLSQQQLAEKIGRSQNWLSLVERGGPGVQVTRRDAVEIAAALGLHPQRLFEEAGE